MRPRLHRTGAWALWLAALLMPAVGVGAGVSGAAPAPARHSHRLIVELESPSTTAAARGQAASLAPETARIDLGSPVARQHIAQLQREQDAFVASLAQAAPGARLATYRNEQGQTLAATYQVLLNAVALEAGPGVDLDGLAQTLRGLPKVRRVSRDWAHSATLYASLPLVNAEAAWSHPAIGGAGRAGRGVKLASMDGGIHRDAPMFDGTGYSYPPGFPKGDTRNTNGKIIASRVYFRTWDPPSEGDENPWPGTKGTPHGVHTASTAAGNAVSARFLGAPPVTLSGVAPQAYVMSYRVFYNSITDDGVFYTVEGLKALEDIVRDGAEVLNNSWGGGPSSTGGEYDALDAALIQAVRAGLFVSMSAGNAGPGPATVDHPSPDYIEVAASSTPGTYASGRLDATAPTPVPQTLQRLPYGTADFGTPLPLGTLVGPYAYRHAADVDAANADGCNPWPAQTFAGLAALIVRGSCDFSLKVLNAEHAGARFVVVYNHATGGDQVMDMGAGAAGGQVTLQAVFVGRSHGLALADWQTAHPETARLSVDTQGYQIGNTADVIADFSSRGPGVGLVLKPDVAAPGVSILAQGYAPGATGEARHLGFGQASGTSMAAPHVAGAGALLRQIHPEWSPAWIKSALMSTAKYLDIYTDAARTTPAQPLDMGAGRIDLARAVDPGVVLSPPSLSFGAARPGATRTLTVRVTSVAATAQTYAVSTVYTGGGFAALAPVAGLSVAPASLTLEPGASATLTLSWATDRAGGVGDRQGYVLLKSNDHEAHLPAWLRVSYPDNPQLGEVLVIDNDGSTGAGATDYNHHYTRALESLGIRYDVWDADDASHDPIPDANLLAQYAWVIYQTGDNAQPLPTPSSDRLVEYVNNRGHLLAFGQDLSWVTEDSFFYQTLLGAKRLRDSVSGDRVLTQSAQLLSGVEGSPFADLSFDVSARGDGAANQTSIDEITREPCEPDSPALCLDQLRPLLRYAAGGTPVGQGWVALSHRDQPTLERRGSTFLGSALYFAFGLEGVNDDTGYGTRASLLQKARAWSLDRASTAITASPRPQGQVSTFKAAMASTQGGEGVNFRWNFGDGSASTPRYASATAGHTYAAPGTYVVTVEAANALGTRAIGTATVTIEAAPLHAPAEPGECVLDWAERTYPAQFTPPGAITRRDGPYDARAYPATGLSLGVSSEDRHVYVYRASGERYDAGALSGLLTQAGCTPRPTQCLFNWVEQQYPALFPAATGIDEVSHTYVYRRYPQTGSTQGLHTGTQQMQIMGPDGAVREVGSYAYWMGQAGCAP